MPRRRNAKRIRETKDDVARLEKKLKCYRQWLAAEREALALLERYEARRKAAREDAAARDERRRRESLTHRARRSQRENDGWMKDADPDLYRQIYGDD